VLQRYFFVTEFLWRETKIPLAEVKISLVFLDVDMETLFVIIKKTNALIVHLLIYISMR